MPNPYAFTTLNSNFPTEDREQFFKDMGWDDLIPNTAYTNTCAMRVSVCLVKCGMTFPTGEIKILKGDHEGKRIKIRWNELEDVLKAAWGDPTSVTPTNSEACKPYQGVVAFEKLPSGYSGHIDVLDGPNESCLHAAYFGSDKIRVFEAAADDKK